MPSPEEAAAMCAILDVAPAEILTNPEDIILVQSIIDKKETPTAEDDGLTPQERDLIQRFRKLDQAGQMYVLGITQAASDMQK